MKGCWLSKAWQAPSFLSKTVSPSVPAGTDTGTKQILYDELPLPFPKKAGAIFQYNRYPVRGMITGYIGEKRNRNAIIEVLFINSDKIF